MLRLQILTFERALVIKTLNQQSYYMEFHLNYSSQQVIKSQENKHMHLLAILKSIQSMTNSCTVMLIINVASGHHIK